MTIVPSHHEFRDYRREGEPTHDLSRVRSTSEMSDGWIDAGLEAGTVPANTQSSQSQAANTTSSIDNQRSTVPAAPASSSPTPALAPLKPQNTNNPFLRHKSSGAAGEPATPQLTKTHAAAWADLLPSTSSDDIPEPSSQGANTQHPAVATTSPWDEEQEDIGAHAKNKGKGKEPALDHMGLPNTQESGTISSGQVSRKPVPQAVAEEEYAPPLGPPPRVQAEEVYPPPPGPPPPKNETYQIKHIRWVDYASGDSTRTSPILMQNINGPCPLLALVNALTLSTPRKTESSLVEALRTREQVSLGLLLDAVVEELISNRMSSQKELPDMVELYDFLRALHTGMNVNPAFISAVEEPNLIEFDPGSPDNPQPTRTAGGFENTKEMRLYSTFTIPLIHGWLSPRSHRAYAALERSARTHEDAENLLTREDELEEKLAKEGLLEEEQQLLEDIGAIKYFLTSSATQLTGYGLDIIADTMPPGSFAILFRNNHFSTLHKHPLTGTVFSVVTDLGYAKYPEIVWESLIDTNGLGSELFSGDFRTVSHGSNAAVSGSNDFSSDTGGEWSTVIRGGKSKQSAQRPANEAGSSATNEASASTHHEQEDADLALALQLQEEEEERHRRENPPPRAQAARQSSSQGGRRVSTGQQSRLQLPPQATPPRRLAVQTSGNTLSSSSANRGPRVAQPNNSPFQPNAARRRPLPATVRRDPNGPSDEPPPPSYEDALEETPYMPPEGSQHHPVSPLPSPVIPQRSSGGTAFNVDELMARAEAESSPAGRNRPRQISTPQFSAWNQMAAENQGHAYAEAERRRRASGGQEVWPQERPNKDRDCVVM